MNKRAQLSGRITSWKDDRGFGFITPAGGGDEVFVHISAFANRNRRPKGNEAVTYQSKTDAQGRVQAFRVWFADEATKQSTNAPNPAAIAIVSAAFFLLIVAGLVIAGRLPAVVGAVYLVASLAAFIAYAWDKSAARKGGWRTAESTLHLLGMAGGWPGALVARQVFRHKSKKQPFVVVFRLTVALNIGALVWLLTTPGQRFLASLIGGI